MKNSNFGILSFQEYFTKTSNNFFTLHRPSWLQNDNHSWIFPRLFRVLVFTLNTTHTLMAWNYLPVLPYWCLASQSDLRSFFWYLSELPYCCLIILYSGTLKACCYLLQTVMTWNYWPELPYWYLASQLAPDNFLVLG